MNTGSIMSSIDFLKTMQQFVATAAIGTSALRNQVKGSHDAVRKVLSGLDLLPLKNMGRDEYTRWIDATTHSVLLERESSAMGSCEKICKPVHVGCPL